jgi:5'-nucleotidase
MPTILVTNDDGVGARGIRALQEALEELAEVYTVAPDRERSASSHSLTIHKPLRVNRLDKRLFSISGTPTDCVALGVQKILPHRPDLIISGINHGPNLGDDLTYSGTVSAAMEGTILNIPSVAVSLNVENGKEAFFETASAVAREMAGMVLEKSLPYDTLLNVNVPNVEHKNLAGVKLTRQGKRTYEGAVNETISPWGEVYYWIGGGVPYWEHGEDTDINAVREGYVSVTPLHLDLTNHGAMTFLKEQWTQWITRE